MFEKYTEKARRVIFFARYEASQLGSRCIETEHILLGLLREDKALTSRFFPRADTTIDGIRKEIEGRTSVQDIILTINGQFILNLSMKVDQFQQSLALKKMNPIH